MATSDERYRKIELSLLFLAVVFSAVSTLVAARAISASKTQAATQAKYVIRQESLITYVEGHAAYETALYEVRNRLPFDIEEVDRVNGLTLIDLKTLRDAVDPIIAANQAYEASFRATIPAWPKSIRGLLVTAAKRGDAMGNCYEQASIRALDENEAAQVRANLNAKCRDLGTAQRQFEIASNAAYKEMANEIYKAAIKLGADPEIASPDPAHR